MAIAGTRLIRWAHAALPIALTVGCSFDAAPSLGRRALDPAVVGWPNAPAGHNFDAGPGVADAGTFTQTDAADNPTAVQLPMAAMNGSHDSAVADANMPSSDDDASTQDDSDSAVTVDAGGASNPRPCMTGTYVGNFTCTVDPTGVTPFTAMAQGAFFVLQMSPNNARILSVQTSNFAFDIVGVLFAGDVSGDLDCDMGTFRADIVNGVFTPIPFPVPLPFVGQITGKLDNTGRTLSGDWLFTAPTGDICTGQWSASLQR